MPVPMATTTKPPCIYAGMPSEREKLTLYVKQRPRRTRDKDARYGTSRTLEEDDRADPAGLLTRKTGKWKQKRREPTGGHETSWASGYRARKEIKRTLTRRVRSSHSLSPRPAVKVVMDVETGRRNHRGPIWFCDR
ncbi:hypothetical protein GWI33_004401 [Rhynchophorus ferrugineus]|uniref:Uncharacterized protein n=1 Tax=Rhynchophorus ferrugineus TaxID=354439 RepID=A0A834IIW7_RHYFE|nr:hypothetical protein GWI33_004401 [Rhynchophorus ferrugineus]